MNYELPATLSKPRSKPQSCTQHGQLAVSFLSIRRDWKCILNFSITLKKIYWVSFSVFLWMCNLAFKRNLQSIIHFFHGIVTFLMRCWLIKMNDFCNFAFNTLMHQLSFSNNQQAQLLFIPLFWITTMMQDLILISLYISH